jgi:ornithine--oxo-acid transaminase
MKLTGKMRTEDYIRIEREYGVGNYESLPVVLSKAEGVWAWDVEGKRYIDMLSSYSAVNQGHRHPKIIKALEEQVKNLTLTSRAFYNDKLGLFLKNLSNICEMECALPMNTGAEGVETAIKMARRWGYYKKKVEKDKAEIIVCEKNFHGRTTTIVGFSSDLCSYGGFGPFSQGFVKIPFNNPEALKKAITPNTAAFLVEPIQGEAGVIIPNKDYLKKVRKICTENNVLLILDEVQTGFGRTGKLFCYQHEDIRPDALILGKALGGGIYPISAVVSSKENMSVFTPGSHGSTFGGNPLACAIAKASLEVLLEENLAENSAKMGEYFLGKLKSIESQKIESIRGKGLLIAVDIKHECLPARNLCQKLIEKGVLAKDTHNKTIRFAPPLVIKKEEIDWACERIEKVLLDKN